MLPNNNTQKSEIKEIMPKDLRPFWADGFPKPDSIKGALISNRANGIDEWSRGILKSCSVFGKLSFRKFLPRHGCRNFYGFVLNP